MITGAKAIPFRARAAHFPRRRVRLAALLLALGAVTGEPAQAADPASPAADATPAAVAAPAAAVATSAPAATAEPNWYVERRSYGTRRVPEPPAYVRNYGDTWLARDTGTTDVRWLDVGLDHRTRFEWRDNDFRRSVKDVDQPFLLRTRAYVAIHDVIDPLRFTVEISDARRYNGDFPKDTRDFNYVEPLQAYGELYFKDSLVAGKPLSIKFGRQAFEYLDRRLLARNEFRNTTNNFDGLRVILGEQRESWQVDVLALQPVIRDIQGVDDRDHAIWLAGFIGDWRGWSRYVTIQPLYLILKQDGQKSTTRVQREIHTYGARAYGVLGKTGFDYDFMVLGQSGNDGPRDHSAHAWVADVGYVFPGAWKPRLSATYNYASGDTNPTDKRSGRFERLYGFARPFSQDDYFQFENIHAPKVRFELTPHPTLQWDAGLSWYSLDSATDRWNNARLRDPSGQSGSFLGNEVDTRVVWTPSKQFNLEVLYAYFKAGTFVENVGRGGTSNLVFVQASFSAF